MNPSIVRIYLTSFFLVLLLMQQGCISSRNGKSDNFPTQADFPGYQLIDARYDKNISLSVRQNKNIAVVVKDLVVTAYYNIDTPRYDKDFVFFAGTERCCAPKEPLMGASGLLVYRFHILNKTGKTNIDIIARHKGLEEKKEHYNSDIVTKVNLKVK